MHKPGSYKPSQEALDMHAADVSAAAERGKLLDAARAGGRRAAAGAGSAAPRSPSCTGWRRNSTPR